MSARLAVVPELDSELDDLFGRPLSEFTSARNELARRLKKAGQEEAASRVQSLKKPSVPVWTVNQLARRHPDEVRELVEAGERLRKAQEEAFRGSGTEAVREATGAERNAARRLTRLAHDLLEADGRPVTRAVTDRIGSVLRAAAIDPAAAELLEAGQLAEEVESLGFGAVAGIAPKTPRPPRAKPRPKEERERQERERLRKRLEAQVERLRRAAEAAEGKADRAERAAEEARADAAEARSALAAAEHELEGLA